ncbi:MAG: hypothetical protein QF600_04255 [Verrucomicrobiota bacterium]|jgi:hypothetical protein|nr:hypothetical protein [Verrucomicrobiota bacterium]
MKTPCSNCNQRLEIPEELAGQSIECPACKATLTVPSAVNELTPTPSVKTPKPGTKKKKRSKSPQAKPESESNNPVPKWVIVIGVCALIPVVILLFSSALANVILQVACAAVSLICFIATVKSMFDLEKSGIAYASIVLLFCSGLGGLIAYIWSWTQEDERPTTLIWTFAIAGSILARGILGPAFGSN